MTNTKEFSHEEVYIKITDLSKEDMGDFLLNVLGDETLSFKAMQVYYCLLHYPLSSEGTRTLSDQVKTFLDMTQKDFKECKRELTAAGHLKEGRL